MADHDVFLCHAWEPERKRLADELREALEFGEGDPSARLADRLRTWIAGMGSEVGSSS